MSKRWSDGKHTDRQDDCGNLICESAAESAAEYSLADLYGRQGMSSRQNLAEHSVSQLCRNCRVGAPNYRIRVTLALDLPCDEVVLF